MALNAPITAYSHAAFQSHLRLGTHTAIKTYNRTLNRVDAAFYLTTIIVRLQGSASLRFEAEITQVSGAIAQEVRRLERFLEQEQQVVKKRLNTLPPAKEPVHLVYTQPVEVAPLVRTPKGRDYVGLIGQLEQMTRQFDQLWAAGALTDLEHLQRQREHFRNFSRTCQVIERLARGLARRVQGHNQTVNVTYQDMLVKRTGRGPGQEKPDPVPAEDNEHMTDQEAESLADLETLAVGLEASMSPTLLGLDSSASVSETRATDPDPPVLAAPAEAVESGPEAPPRLDEVLAMPTAAAVHRRPRIIERLAM
ncbi:MAG: hypothetical protein WAW42_02490 [Candidatus Competibacteraceae bacterium]